MRLWLGLKVNEMRVGRLGTMVVVVVVVCVVRRRYDLVRPYDALTMDPGIMLGVWDGMDRGC